MYTLLDAMFANDFSQTNGDHAVELKDTYMLTVELPGVKKENIKMEVDDSYLTITADKKNPFDSSAKVLLNSRSYKPFEKTYKLGEGINKEAIEAEFVDGVLTIALPKEDKVKTRNIKIS